MRVSIKKDSSIMVDVGGYFSVHQQLWVFSVRGFKVRLYLQITSLGCLGTLESVQKAFKCHGVKAIGAIIV